MIEFPIHKTGINMVICKIAQKKIIISFIPITLKFIYYKTFVLKPKLSPHFKLALVFRYMQRKSGIYFSGRIMVFCSCNLIFPLIQSQKSCIAYLGILPIIGKTIELWTKTIGNVQAPCYILCVFKHRFFVCLSFLKCL